MNRAVGKRRKRVDRYGNTSSQRWFIFALLLIPMLNFLVFTIYANFGGIFLSFQQFDGVNEYWVGLANYEKYFKTFYRSGYDQDLLVSFGYLLVVGLISLPISVIVAFFLYKKIPFSGVTLVFLYLPNIIPAAVMAEFYRRMWDSGGGGASTGLLNLFFSLFNGGEEVNWLTLNDKANYALWIYTIWFGFGYNAILIWGAMKRIPVEVLESAKIDGCGVWREFFKIVIPMIWPTLSMVIVLTATVPFQVYMQPLLLDSNGLHGTRTMALTVIQEIKRPDPYYAAALQIMIACISIPTTLFVKKATDKVFDTVEM